MEVSVVWIIFFTFSSSVVFLQAKLPDGVYQVALDTSSRHKMFWAVDFSLEEVKFEIHASVSPAEWFAVGFSDYGSFAGADFCVLMPRHHHTPSFKGFWTDDKCLAKPHPLNECRNFSYVVDKTITKFTFARSFRPCGSHHYNFEEGTTHILYAVGSGPIEWLSMCGRGESGMTRVQLLKRVQPAMRKSERRVIFEATVSDVSVPSSDTTYWCHSVLLPSHLGEVKHHVVQFEPLITKGHEGLVHHMELFHCEADRSEEMPFYSGPCPEKPPQLRVCSKVLAAWAMGASAFHYPEEAGLPVGGPDYSLYAMLEIHYNNPQLRSDWIDSSGLKVEMTSDLRPNDAGVIELGLEYIDKMAIPPQQSEFTLTGYCISECTAVGLPPRGVMVFASQLHTHLTGVKVESRHVRRGRELSPLNFDYHYSPHFQEIRLLPRQVHVLPGDALVTTCTYSTTSRTNVTLGGFATTDEMCVNYIYYYPKTELEVCKSSVSDSYLKDYFNTLKTWEDQRTGSHLPISESYLGIEWNPLRVYNLKRLYAESPIYMQCNTSSGSRFPGEWSEMPTTVISVPLPVPEPGCNPLPIH